MTAAPKQRSGKVASRASSISATLLVVPAVSRPRRNGAVLAGRAATARRNTALLGVCRQKKIPHQIVSARTARRWRTERKCVFFCVPVVIVGSFLRGGD